MTGEARPHRFTIRVELRGHGCDWSSMLPPVEVEAQNVREALRIAASLPLAEWFRAAGQDERIEGEECD